MFIDLLRDLNPKEFTITAHLIFVNIWKSTQIIEHEK